ncbi:DUF4865 family protein [Dyella tabacisoli]|uniref:DUF4865 family protein n=1 Tax=Dyella tabacisoli TaxID=2282381 RepID=A0A369UNJ1_9GAMM|nr:DUF4865 family protein [Dyella tabacisoli]RDD82332.1 DUF4865 family protein [Dyella tabacisoli]
MIAMQYSFVLPADYDMAIIRQRIASKGHLLDNFPNLLFKAYLSADRSKPGLPSQDNLYAPFYLWQNSDGMNDFLGSDGFAALTQSFGWPSVQTWSVWQASLSPDLPKAVCATREIVAIPAYAALDEWQHQERDVAQRDLADGALGTVTAYEPAHWTLVRFRLWGEPRADLASEGRQMYDVGHISMPNAKN